MFFYSSILFNYLQNFLDFCFPHSCILCHEHSHRNIDLCIHCENELPLIQHHCHCCGIPLPSDIQICGKCLKRKPPFDKTYPLFHYKTPIIQMITSLKFHQQLVMSQVLGKLLAKHIILTQKPDYILPVPLHPKRLKERGFNQALEIARPMAKQLNIPIATNICKRVRNTQAQTSIPAKLRRKNVKEAFQMIYPVQAKHIVILDDVITTGSTVLELSRTLRKAGAKTIEVLCCARTS